MIVCQDGSYTIHVGRSSRSLRLSVAVQVSALCVLGDSSPATDAGRADGSGSACAQPGRAGVLRRPGPRGALAVPPRCQNRLLGMQLSGDLTGFGVNDGRLRWRQRAGRPRRSRPVPHSGQSLMVVLERSHDVLLPSCDLGTRLTHHLRHVRQDVVDPVGADGLRIAAGQQARRRLLTPPRRR